MQLNLTAPRRGLALATLAFSAFVIGRLPGATDQAASPEPTLRKYCFQCHATSVRMGGISLEQLLANHSIGADYQQWQKVIAALDQKRMPPKGLPQPAEGERAQVVSWVRSEMNAFTAKHAGDPGRVTVRRLTSGEYAYAIRDLMGIEIDTGIDAATDSVGGEGFTNFGDVQFMQDASLERYLAAAKKVADHAVIGVGPLEFYSDPGHTGFEMSAIHRIKEIVNENGFRTVSGEGGFPFGLERYGKVFYVAWEFRHRAALGMPNAKIEDLAAREGINGRFAKHIWAVVNDPSLSHPSSEAAARWKKIAAPTGDKKASEAAARKACEDLQNYVTNWPLWLFARGDQAVGGAGDESPLIINDKSLTVPARRHFVFNRFARPPAPGAAPPPPEPSGPATVYLNVEAVNPRGEAKPTIIWRNATIAYRKPGALPPPEPVAGDQNTPAAPKGIALQPKQPLRTVVDEETAKRLGFGESRDGSKIGPNDFVSHLATSFVVPVPQGVTGFQLQVDAELGSDREAVLRIVITDRADGSSRGIPVRSLLGDVQTAGYRKFKEGVLELVKLMPPNSQSEATPADKDPVPEPFDSRYNVPEHDDFDTRVKYIRDDRYLYQNILDEPQRKRLDDAWTDLYASFEYHDNYLDLLAKHFNLDLKGKHVAELTQADLDAMPEPMRKYASPIKSEYDSVVAAQAAARPKRLADCLEFAALAWRRPLTDAEKRDLRGFYDKMMSADPDYRKAIRGVLTRILVAPAFLYRLEETANVAPVKPLTQWETASRLSFFLWSSIPDAELRRAAAAGELSNPEQLKRQVKRMLGDAKARRLSTEFFGQWLGFYHFDQHRGVDTGRFPEFTDEVRAAMYDESVSFFEHIIRKDRPVMEMLSANYTFLNKPLAKFYGVKSEVASTDHVELVEGAEKRGGVLRLGALLTVTSAPLRTSPVKRGDWVLRRLLGTSVPPPPSDAGSIPADDKLFGGLSLREKLEAHKRNATCANCHVRIDPLGFPLEHYDSTGRFRMQYMDGKAIWDRGTSTDRTEIEGVDGLMKYLESKDEQVRRTFSSKLLGYALGRAVQASDQPLIDRMVAAGHNATFSQLTSEIILSKQFRNRAGGGEDSEIASNLGRAATGSGRAATGSGRAATVRERSTGGHQ